MIIATDALLTSMANAPSGEAALKLYVDELNKPENKRMKFSILTRLHAVFLKWGYTPAWSPPSEELPS